MHCVEIIKSNDVGAFSAHILCGVSDCQIGGSTRVESDDFQRPTEAIKVADGVDYLSGAVSSPTSDVDCPNAKRLCVIVRNERSNDEDHVEIRRAYGPKRVGSRA